MKVLYYEDLANHVGPEPHGGCGNTMADALVGENVGGLSSSENTTIRVPTSLPDREGHTSRRVIASIVKTQRSLRTWHALKPHARESGGPGIFHHLLAGIGDSSREKSPGASVVALKGCKRRTRKEGKSEWMGRRRRNAVRSAHNGFRKSDNNIVPEKAANKGNISPPRSRRREGR